MRFNHRDLDSSKSPATTITSTDIRRFINIGSSGVHDNDGENNFRVLMRTLLDAGYGAIIRADIPSVNECIPLLESLFVCLPYAQGKDAVPPPNCCLNLDNVFKTQKACLCELIAAGFNGSQSNVSSLIPPFNVTLALQMPQACSVPADPSECPEVSS
ncbi:hypothetical protein KP509_01G102400 [Ceratopteris richardii]|nr:hypothetical protein KP509_01G102400 [Ceratopteris richardii]